ncbi:MAG TPA: LysM peptidoglycan-binding domain-containing protein [Anaerolineales bacterium]|nr:LysM peptidoglycan-binding domain-containing protein [Anaerolineales bacterium]
MRFKRLVYYLTLNVLVSACTVLVILYYWEQYKPLESGAEPAPIALATSTATAPVITLEAGTTNPAGPDGGTVSPPDFINYTVQPGDTLSGIAFDFDVSVEEILAANDLDNPDTLDVGDVILIPVGGAVPEATAPPSTAVSATPPPPPTLPPQEATPGEAGETVLEIVTVIGTGDLAQERVVVRQNGDAQVALQGWQLLGPDGQVFNFPQLVLFQGGAVSVYTRAGSSSVAELYWGLAESIWISGDVVTLLDPDGNIVAAYQVP